MAIAGYEYRVNGGTAVDVGNVLLTTVSGLTPDTDYEFEVRSYDDSGNRSAWSAVVSARTEALPPLDGSNIYCSGNSLTLGYPDHAPWDYPTRMNTLMTSAGIVGHTVTNIGHDLAETNALAGYATTEMYPFLDADRRNIAIINEIGNDIYFNGSVANAITNFTTWYDDIIAEGWEVLVLNMFHRGTVASANTLFGDTEAQYQTKLASARSLLTAWAASNDVNIVELIDDVRLSDCTNATYFTDRVHLTHAGYLAMAEDVYAGLIAIPYTDTLAPVLTTATVEDADPAEIVLTYNEHLDETSIPANANFAMSGGRTVTNVSITNNIVTVTVNTPYTSGDSITISYTPGTNKIQDLAGNLAVALTTEAVDNNIDPVETALTFGDFTFMTQVGTTLSTTGSITAWNHFGEATDKLPASTDGYIKARFPDSTGCILGFNTTDESASYPNIEYYAFQSGGIWYWGGNASPTATAVTFVADDEVKVERVAGTISAYRVRGGVETLIHTFAGTNNADLFINAVIAVEGETIEEPVGVNVVPV